MMNKKNNETLPGSRCSLIFLEGLFTLQLRLQVRKSENKRIAEILLLRFYKKHSSSSLKAEQNTRYE